MDNDFNFILLKIYFNTDDKDLIDTICTILEGNRNNATNDNTNLVKSLDTRYNEKSQDNSDEEPRNTFDSFDWSDIELKPTDLPRRIDSEINSNIPSVVKDGDIVPRYINNHVFIVQFIEKLALDYIAIDVKRIKGTKHND